VPGAIVGGLIIGASEKLAEIYIPPVFQSVFGGNFGGIEGWFPYVLALLFLLVRPRGCSARSTSTASDGEPTCFIAKPASSRPATPPTARSSRSGRTASSLPADGGGVRGVPLVGSEYWLSPS
jgi:hypothetical protein